MYDNWEKQVKVRRIIVSNKLKIVKNEIVFEWVIKIFLSMFTIYLLQQRKMGRWQYYQYFGIHIFKINKT